MRCVCVGGGRAVRRRRSHPSSTGSDPWIGLRIFLRHHLTPAGCVRTVNGWIRGMWDREGRDARLVQQQEDDAEEEDGKLCPFLRRCASCVSWQTTGGNRTNGSET